MHRGYIKLWRKLEDSGLLQMPETFATMIFLILHATHKDVKRGTKYGVINLDRGQGILAIRTLAKDMKLSVQSIRTILVRLERMEILTLKSTHAYSVYTIVNYDKYNDINTPLTHESTNHQHTINTPSTQEQECKNVIIKETISNSKELLVISDANDCPHQEIINNYHEILPELPAVRIWTDKRKKLLAARWKEDKDRQNIEWWRKFFRFVRTSDFLMGRSSSFQANLEWLVNASNFVKVIEGNYDNRAAA